MSAAVATLPKAQQVNAEIVRVTPKLAQQMLATNKVNRTIRSHNVDKYARSMKAGQWIMTGEAIKLAEDGTLLDGQHRLLAVIKADVSVDLLFVRGLDNSSQVEMDSGAKRTAADALGFRGEQNTALLAAGARVIILVESGRINQDRKSHALGNGEIATFVENNPEIRDAVTASERWRSRIDAPPSVIVAAYYLLSQVHQRKAVQFFDSLATRANLVPGSAIIALDSRLRNLRKSGARPSQRDYLNLFFKAWNYWRRNRSAASLAVGGNLVEPK